MGERFQRSPSLLFPARLRGIPRSGSSLSSPIAFNFTAAAAREPTLDFMASFPIVVPRLVLPEVRRLVSLVQQTYFDAAFVKMRMPSHGDLIGKTALLQFPDLINFTHCPNVNREHRELAGEPNRCRWFISPVEHIRHPIQGCTEARCRYLTAGAAAPYGGHLLNQSRLYASGKSAMPPAPLYMYAPRSATYKHGLSPEERARAAMDLLRADPKDSLCGVPKLSRERQRAL